MTNTMKIGPVAHGVLLVGALLLAYQTWTREDTVDRKIGNVKVWSESPQALIAIEYQTNDRTIRVEYRGEGKDRYLWGTDTRVITKRAPKPKQDPAAGPVLPEPEPEKETRIKQFAVNAKDKGDALVRDLSSLHALIDLGTLDDDKKKEYGLASAEDSIDVFFDGGVTHSLLLGSKVYGSADRYAIAVDTSRAYVIAGQVMSDLLNGEQGLKQRKAHAFDDADIGKVSVTVGDKVRALVRITRTDDKGKETKAWADATTPDKPDQTMDNFLKNVSRLMPSEYEPDRKADALELLVKLEYRRADGSELGWLELYKEKPEPEEAPTPPATPPADGAAPVTPDGAAPATTPDGAPATTPDGAPAAADKPADKPKKPKAPLKYYLRTEATRVFAATSTNTATRIAEDLAQLFTE